MNKAFNGDEEGILQPENVLRCTESDHQPKESKSSSVRCGPFSFMDPCEVEFSHPVYANAEVAFELFKDNFILDKKLNLEHIEVEQISLNMGMEVAVDTDRFPDFAETKFVIFGFVEYPKVPKACRAIILNPMNGFFSVVYVTDLFVDWKPVQRPDILRQFCAEFKEWAANVKENGMGLAELGLRFKKKHNKNRNVSISNAALPARRSLARGAKTNARSRILEMSPSKTTKEDKDEMSEPEEQATQPDNASLQILVKQIKTLENKNKDLKKHLSQLQNKQAVDTVTLLDLKKRVEVLEAASTHNVSLQAPKRSRSRSLSGKQSKVLVCTPGQSEVEEEEAMDKKIKAALSRFIKQDPGVEQNHNQAQPTLPQPFPQLSIATGTPSQQPIPIPVNNMQYMMLPHYPAQPVMHPPPYPYAPFYPR